MARCLSLSLGHDWLIINLEGGISLFNSCTYFSIFAEKELDNVFGGNICFIYPVTKFR